MDSYPRETVEFLPVTITVDGVVVTSGVKFTTTTGVDRPTGWSDPTVLEDKIGIMVTGFDSGLYRVWAQVTDTPEIPVIDCGQFRVT